MLRDMVFDARIFVTVRVYVEVIVLRGFGVTVDTQDVDARVRIVIVEGEEGVTVEMQDVEIRVRMVIVEGGNGVNVRVEMDNEVIDFVEMEIEVVVSKDARQLWVIVLRIVTGLVVVMGGITNVDVRMVG